MIDKDFWKGQRVFFTGNTGFKGSWLSIWLQTLGAEVQGYSLQPPTEPSLFELSGLRQRMHTTYSDIRESRELTSAMRSFEPTIVIHMAAQPLVRESYTNPADTYAINVMGTVNLFEAVRQCGSVRAVINVTTDKCYDNKEWVWGYRENEALGGYDPYSNSKACSELVTSAYRNSFFNVSDYASHGVAIASARAGNVIGGGDWAKDRLLPDIVRSLIQDETIVLRNPNSIRPWQHVLEPLSGYLLLAERLVKQGALYAESWNFGPEDADAQPVKWIAEQMRLKWNSDLAIAIDENIQPHEAHYLKLDCSKAKMLLDWRPRWSLSTALEQIVAWNKAFVGGSDILDLCVGQINQYENTDVEVPR